uniref:Uncharacterized protein n=1 Tax=Solanum lycopersicum TaxID=4081 RepID=A0A3Q7G211_SOLLC
MTGLCSPGNSAASSGVNFMKTSLAGSITLRSLPEIVLAEGYWEIAGYPANTWWKNMGQIGLTMQIMWQQLLINRLVGYDTILMNSLLTSPGEGIKYSRPQNLLSVYLLSTAYPEVLCSTTIFHDVGHSTV